VVKGYNVIIVSRTNVERRPHAKVSYALWDIEQQTIDAAAIAKADYIIHLAGAGVADKRWSKKRKQEILDSRTHSSATIVKALQQTPNQVKAIVSASGIGWYGADTEDSLQHPFTEDAPSDADFLGETCCLWEQSIEPVTQLGKRLVKFRTGIVLSNTGGALVEFKKPLQFGIAGILGNGNQLISWIHVEDVCRMYVHAIENEQVHGVYNAVTASPVSNKTLTIALAKMLRGKWYIPIHIPSFLLQWILGEMSVEVLKSTNVSNQKIKSTGFSYHHPNLQEALESLQ
jgi:uncharacterized protein (TIGR01777 family)